ncbi:MAG TPA: HoxN/HupN/NixA family nickel/cobalt transporter [Xanthobacteraceae bacterium]|nr:HoxN/HupN/NixA family nickel/cobalt transporter [Xanthobacteraceae bacterium]
MPLRPMTFLPGICPSGRHNILLIYATLIAANVAVWTWAFSAFHDYPVLLGTAFLAYSFGLRHAVDADHIAAIDNVTRKLMHEGKRPLGTGLFFSLGHATVVVLASIGIVFAATAFKDRMDSFHSIGGVIGTTVSAAFLLLIGVINTFILVEVYRVFQRVKSGGSYADDGLDSLLAKGGFFARIFHRLFRMIGRSWHMYPLGLLFGLGFDTASEVALLGITAAQASSGLSMWSILIFPALFTAGMTLLDTTDSILMVRAYGWAFVRPVRKLYYNMTITFVSVVVAVAVGGTEVLGLIAGKFGLNGGFWSAVDALNERMDLLGYGIVAIFIGSWLISMLIYRLRGYDGIETQPSR